MKRPEPRCAEGKALAERIEREACDLLSYLARREGLQEALAQLKKRNLDSYHAAAELLCRRLSRILICKLAPGLCEENDTLRRQYLLK